MSRLDLARTLLVLTGVVAGFIIFFVAILYREQRRRSGWSTRYRSTHSHWSIALKDRLVKAADRLSIRRTKSRRKRTKRKL